MSFGQGPTNLMKSLAVWRASRRGPGRGTGRAEDVGIVDGTGGDHRALQAYADGSGPPRGPRRGRWGWGGGGDGGGDGDGHEKFWVGSNVAAVGAMQVRPPFTGAQVNSNSTSCPNQFSARLLPLRPGSHAD